MYPSLSAGRKAHVFQKCCVSGIQSIPFFTFCIRSLLPQTKAPKCLPHLCHHNPHTSHIPNLIHISPCPFHLQLTATSKHTRMPAPPLPPQPTQNPHPIPNSHPPLPFPFAACCHKQTHSHACPTFATTIHTQATSHTSYHISPCHVHLQLTATN